jgi:hypothetical protein
MAYLRADRVVAAEGKSVLMEAECVQGAGDVAGRRRGEGIG